ncbi:MAG: LysM peptidoglycan-binding domain-containing protein [Anaerolineae bacterium]|nr:LysM peptidoglycan-binding domain-containing protein [Anaerolineae bacterium]
MIVFSFCLTACDAILTPPPQTPTSTPTSLSFSGAKATPTIIPGTFLTPIPPTPTFTPTPVPTPVVHVIEQGDTLFGIALEYGVSFDALVRVNGLDAEQILRIGQTLVIPLDEEEESVVPGIAAPVNNLILPTPTPLSLSTMEVVLYKTPVGGFWCMGEVLNTTGMPVTNLQLLVTLATVDGTPLLSQVALAAADYLGSEQRAPFAVLFQNPPAGVSDVATLRCHVSFLRSEPVGEITAGFVALNTEDVEGAVSGPQYRVRGNVVNTTDTAVQRIVVVVTLYDIDEKILAYRQIVLREEQVLDVGQMQSFSLLLTPQGIAVPASFQVLAWGNRAD